MEALERAQEVLAGWDERVRAGLPADLEIFDAHTHLGTDIDGMVGVYEDLIGAMDRYGVSRANVFCLDEPDRHPGFTAANDRTLAFATRSEGRIVPYVRLDLDEGPVEEAGRCLDLGAQGIKLHPRAQKFLADDVRLEVVFALAAERSVPILIHAGRGLPPIAAGLEKLVDDHPGSQLILAHGGIADLGHLAHRFAGKRGVFFDTSVWSGVDLFSLLRLVPPEQIIFASDYPYGELSGSLLRTLRAARAAGYDERQLREMLGGTAARIADGGEPCEPSSLPGNAELSQPLAHARIHSYLASIIPVLFRDATPDEVGVLHLPLNATHDPNGSHSEELEQIRELLLAARDVWQVLLDVDEADRPAARRTAVRLIATADLIAVTPA